MAETVPPLEPAPWLEFHPITMPPTADDDRRKNPDSVIRIDGQDHLFREADMNLRPRSRRRMQRADRTFGELHRCPPTPLRGNHMPPRNRANRVPGRLSRNPLFRLILLFLLAALPDGPADAAASIVTSISSDDFADLRTVESTVIELVDRVTPAVVRIDAGSRFRTSASGVIFDPSGLVLTAGHVVRDLPRRLWIELPDGTRRRGRVIGGYFEGDVDLGLIEILRTDADAGTAWPFAPLAAARSVDQGEWIIALGHAAAISGQDFEPAAARVGRVIAIEGAELAFDAPIDAGDSGGPILDLDGDIVGIASRCGHETWQNLATSIDGIHAWMPSLLDPEVQSPDHDLWEGRTTRRAPTGTRRDPKLLSRLQTLVKPISPRIVEIRDRDRLIGHGTVVAADRVIAKASQIARHARATSVVRSSRPGVPALRYDARPIAIDSELDLILLEVPGMDLDEDLPFGDPIPTREAKIEAGTLLVVPSPSGRASGIAFVARDRDELHVDDNPDDRPFLGIGSAPSGDGGLRVQQVVANSSAARAGLEVGDVIRRLDGTSVRRSRDLFAILGDRRVGDGITLELERNEETRRLDLDLGLRPDTSRIGIPSNTSTGTSRVSSGFGAVHLIDADRPLESIGGPVIDLDGRMSGWIIARRSRTSMVMVPWERVEESLIAIEERGMVDQTAISDRLCSYRIVATPDGKGVIRLDAEDAYPDGSGIRREKLGPEGRTTWGYWNRVEDALEWTATIDRPGRWLVQLRTACPRSQAGTPIRVMIGDQTVDGRIEATQGWQDFQRQDVGVVEVRDGGTVVIRLESRSRPREAVANLLGVELRWLRDQDTLE